MRLRDTDQLHDASLLAQAGAAAVPHEAVRRFLPHQEQLLGFVRSPNLDGLTYQERCPVLGNARDFVEADAALPLFASGPESIAPVAHQGHGLCVPDLL